MFNVLLQILDDGRVTDSQGRTVDFKNTVIIMTSNIGSEFLLEEISAAGEISESARESVEAQLRQSFRPEFLNRIDDTILFKPLQREELKQIVGLQVNILAKRLAERAVEITVSEEALAHIADAAYDPAFGARPLKRYLQRVLETHIARLLIAGKITEGEQLRVEVEDGELSVRTQDTYTASHHVH